MPRPHGGSDPFPIQLNLDRVTFSHPSHQRLVSAKSILDCATAGRNQVDELFAFKTN
jgi:hypothetical protein